MYIKKIILKNTGPIDRFEYEFPIQNGCPKPVVFVGANGSGKSVLLSHLLNPIMTAQQVAFDDSEVERDRVFKLRSPLYIKTGANFSYSKVVFGDGFGCEEWMLSHKRSEHEKQFGRPSIDSSYSEIPAENSSFFKPDFAHRIADISKQFTKNCILYFPANRFEHPAWLNERNLKSTAVFVDPAQIERQSKRKIIQDSPLNTTKDWLLDVLLDRSIYEIDVKPCYIITHQGYELISRLHGHVGVATNIWEAINQVAKLVLRTNDKVRFGVGPRRSRTVSLVRDIERRVENVVPNIFQLSTGQTTLLNFFLSIIRDFDASGCEFTTIDEIKGVVIIDEVDAHLHCDLQSNLLPQLIKMFPRVQFILTTHSPLFLLGMRTHFGKDGFDVRSLPSGDKVDIEEFEEFRAAYEQFAQTESYRQKLEREILATQKPAIFVEGDYDIKYLQKAATLLGRESILNGITLHDGEGFGNLDKVWKSCESRVSVALPKLVGLIYDCDTCKKNQDNNRAKKRIVESIVENPIAKGIENLFSPETVSRIRGSHSRFFDITPAMIRTVRGIPETTVEVCEVNKSEKKNLCDWLCENGDKEDFKNFARVFDIIAEIAPPENNSNSSQVEYSIPECPTVISEGQMNGSSFTIDVENITPLHLGNVEFYSASDSIPNFPENGESIQDPPA